eukprot:380068_1
MPSSESRHYQNNDNPQNTDKDVKLPTKMNYKLEYLPQLLQDAEQQIFLQLLWETINDILANKEDKKWHKLQLTKIEEKLSKRGCILLSHVLTSSHFSLSNDGTALIFNQKKMFELQQINELLLTQNIIYKQINKKLKNIENIMIQQRKLFASNQNHDVDEKQYD